MAFRLTRRTGAAPETPEALFRDLRNRTVEGLLSQQADMLRAYMGHVNETDVALQMPTGSGKTLVGLLIAEWRRRKYRERSVFLCPTRQLVNQVVEQASEKYGLHTHAMTGPQRDYDAGAKAEYQNAEAIAVTTYSGVFNTNPFFDSAQTIVLDDAHAAENYVADFWSLRINRSSPDQETLFGVLLAAIKAHVSVAEFARLSRDERSPKDALWVDKLPTPILLELHEELLHILDTHITPPSDLSYRWGVLRDHLLACHVYLNCEGFLIRPLLPPTESHPPFAGARQRVYKSATLGEGGELERLVGKRRLTRVPAPEGWERQGVGRRLFFFPTRSLNEEGSLQLVTRMIQRTGRGLVLTPSEWQANQVREQIATTLPGFRLFSAAEIEASKKPFVEADQAVAVIANRYDGIDLVGDECRLLVAWGLPRATHLQESFLISRMGGAILYNDRILTRIVQATGRCTRSATDYAAVVIVGEELSNFLLQADKRGYMHPELQAELEFGIEESKDREIADFLVNLDILLRHGDQWDQADEVIVAARDETDRKELPCVERFVAAVPHEVSYQYAMWNGDYAGAYEACQGVLGHLSGDELRGYRAFWNYLAGSAAWLAAREGAEELEAHARNCFSRSSKAAVAGLPWLHKLSRLGRSAGAPAEESNAGLDTAIERLEGELEDLGTVHSARFERRVQQILDGLGQTGATGFENAQVLLGTLLGYEADNTDENSGPDPWWVLDGKRGVVFEDFTDCASDDPAISTTKVRQASGHPRWLQSQEGLTEVAFTPVIVSPAKRLEAGAKRLASDVYYWSVDDFRTWAEDALTVIRQLRRSFRGAGDLAWRAEAKEAYVTNSLTPNGVIARACACKLSDVGQ